MTNIAQATDLQKSVENTTDLRPSRYIWRPNAKTSHMLLAVWSEEILIQKQP